MRSYVRDFAIGVGVSIIFGVSTAAIAAAPSGMLDVVNIYYANANHTNVVGQVEYDCSGRRTQLGQMTMYQSYVTNDCAETPVPPGSSGGGETYTHCALVLTPYPEYICKP